MKKLALIILITLVSIGILSFIPRIHAATYQAEPDANQGGLWHVQEENRSYIYMRYNHIVSDYVDERDTYVTEETKTEWEFIDPDGNGLGMEFLPHFTYLQGAGYDSYNISYFPNQINQYQQIITNPDSLEYTRFVVEIMHETGNQGEYEFARFNYDDIDTIVVEMYQGDYSRYGMKVKADGQMIIDTRADAGTYSNPRISMYFEKEITEAPIDPNIPGAWNLLPTTTGSPQNPYGDWGTVSHLTNNNNTVSFSIHYQGYIYPISEFSVVGDLSFIERANDVYYYTDKISGDRMLYFNFGDNSSSAILSSTSYESMSEWKGEALWNLSQDEIKVTDMVTTFNYIPEVDQDRNVYSYFYIPNVPIDDIISITSVLAYRFWNDGFLGIGDLKPGEIQYKTVTATKGLTSSVNPTWVEKTYQTFYLGAILIPAITTITGLVPGYGWGIAAAAFLIGGLFEIADKAEWFAYDVEQIQHVIPDLVLTNEINNYIRSVSNDFTFNPSTDKLYKIHLAQLLGGDEVQVMGDLSNVTQVVWETNGQIYMVSEDFINNVDWGGPGTEVPSDNEDFLDKYLPFIIIGLGIVFLAPVLTSIEKTISTLGRLISNPKKLIIIAALIFILLVYLGVIRL